ncbi:unnamed protein product [Absidia cylindrospora]
MVIRFKDDDYEDNEEAHLNFLKGGAKQVRRYAHEILDHVRSIVEVKPNGVIVITPQPRQLATEIISMIVQHASCQHDLFSLALVNKHFHSIVNPLLWKAPKIHHRNVLQRFISCLATAHVPTLGRHIHTLTIAGKFWTDTELSLLLPHLRHLKKIAIAKGTRLTNTSVSHVPQHCPHLTIVLLDYPPITDHNLLQFTQHCPDLYGLRLNPCPVIEDTTFRALVQLPLKQMYLGIDSRNIWTERGIHQLTLCRHLECLYLAGLPPPLVSMVFDKVCSWPDLRQFGLRSCYELDDAALIPFFQAHPRLVFLELSDCNHLFKEENLDIIASALPQLINLRLSSNLVLTPRAVRRLVCRCPQLTSLKLSHCPLISLAQFPNQAKEVTTGVLEITAKGLDTIRQQQNNGAAIDG